MEMDMNVANIIAQRDWKSVICCVALRVFCDERNATNMQ